MKKFVSLLLVVVMVTALCATAALAANPVDDIIDAIQFGKKVEDRKSKGIFDGVFNLVERILDGKYFTIETDDGYIQIPGTLIAIVLDRVQYIVDRLAFNAPKASVVL